MITFLLNDILPVLMPVTESESIDLTYLENEENPKVSDTLLTNESTVSLLAQESPPSEFFLLLKDTIKEQGESEKYPVVTKETSIYEIPQAQQIPKEIAKKDLVLLINKQLDQIENSPAELPSAPLNLKINTEKDEKLTIVAAKEKPKPISIQSQHIKIEAEIAPLSLENRGIELEKHEESNAYSSSQDTSLIETDEVLSSNIKAEVVLMPGQSEQALPALKQTFSSFDQVLVKAETAYEPPYEVFEEKLFNEIRFLIGKEKNTATISMDPPELGKIEVEVVQINEKTHVLFRVPTENGETKELIENSLSKLTHQFSVNGMELGDLSVTQEDFSHTPKKSPEAKYLTFSSKDENSEVEKEIIKTPSSLHLLDLYV